MTIIGNLLTLWLIVKSVIAMVGGGLSISVEAATIDQCARAVYLASVWLLEAGILVLTFFPVLFLLANSLFFLIRKFAELRQQIMLEVERKLAATQRAGNTPLAALVYGLTESEQDPRGDAR